METQQERVCPWWLGYTLIIPWRKYQHNPEAILGPYVKKGMTVMDYGSAMGYFSIPLAQMVGETGKVICVDIQQKMIEKLMSRAANRGLQDIVVPRLVGKNYIPAEFQGKLDFALIFAVVHEVPDKATLFNDLFCMMKPKGNVLFAEPLGHVSPRDFEASLQLARNAGFTVAAEKTVLRKLSAVLVKQSA